MADDQQQHGRVKVAVLGSTGSVGCSTLDVIQRHADRYHAYALCARSNIDLIFSQCEDCKPAFAVLADTDAAAELHLRLQRADSPVTVLAGAREIENIAARDEIDAVMAAQVGFAGLRPVHAAASAGKRILLANKESMVVAGSLLNRVADRSGAQFLPVDSEHNAIFQCLADASVAENGVLSLILTASGGPFRTSTREQIESATLEQALNHPNWSMGSKITIDSATMMNKGFEIIEAHYLFGLPEERIEVLVHPQSIVHSMVRYRDGSVLAQMGNPDMRTPIANVLAWPERIDAGVADLDLTSTGALEFYAPDCQHFPCLDLARQVLRRGGAAAVVLNAANEVTVSRFIDGKIRFVDIARLNSLALERASREVPETVDQLVSIDQQTRDHVESLVANPGQMLERES